ncbi:DNA polymerase III subunit delta' [Rhodomicrobium sp. Az07]|uniref:DNA polymerase III subunit delta' n=1 Tax=Rhodomicrobium sp. Az07 TaxID=2839034 RepID=UPI001BE5AB62|nr:DNA polymerase III subunit delta' [Rhodomicrobium sp. Az07]MBT3070120.1 DNA polymerase III subunit delta' [Rhodomicrobium sp. Az07]
MAKRKAGESEADAGDPLHPRLAGELFGHDEAEAMVLRSFNAGALHHAWLITGERGIGKASFAWRAARFLLSRDGEGGAADRAPATRLDVPSNHPAARQIAAGAHSSLFSLEAGGASAIGVDEVRKLRAFLSLTSPGGWRAMIVDPANDLTIASANALLKAVEEPPPRTVFFLVSHGAASVLPTIRSRCIKLALRPLDAAPFACAVEAACARAGLDAPDTGQMQRLHALSGGSAGRALNLIGGGLLALADKLERVMDRLPRLDHAAVHDLIRSASGAKNAETFARLCDLIEERIEARAKSAAQGAGCNTTEAALWAVAWQGFRERRLETDVLNLDKGAFLLAAFSDMERIARKA